MFSCSMKDRVEEKGMWPCGVCKKGVGNNSILCHGCKKWIHKWCSGVKGSLRNASQSFICRCCKVDRSITDGLNTDLHLDIGNGVLLEKVDKFCYLWDMLDADGGCDSAVTILDKTERQGICYLCEELSDAWQWDLAYESWTWIDDESHWDEYDQMNVWG